MLGTPALLKPAMRPSTLPATTLESIRLSWQKRFAALKNVPPVYIMVWEAAPGLLAASLVVRVSAAMLPLMMLSVTRRIIDSIYVVTSHQKALPAGFWSLVALEFVLASMALILSRVTDFCESGLTDRYAHYVNTRIMRHAATLDLSSYEDSAFNDKLERARVQGPTALG